MNVDLAAVGRLLEQLNTELTLLSVTLRDKGAKRFERPLALSLILAAGSYYLLYLPPQRKAVGLEQRITTARSMAQFADAYKDMRAQLRRIYETLPKTADRDHFLPAAVVESLKAEGLTSDSLRPPDENIDSNLVFQKLTITAEVKFTELMAWLARLEASKPLLFVYSIDLTKSGKRLGYCNIQIGVATIIPAVDLTR